MMPLTINAQPADKTIRLKVIETSDVHGHFFPWDFMEGKPIKGSLTRANTYINNQRKKYGDNLLLIDNGDILQGQPCVYWSNYVMPEDENLAASVVNYMKYDAETVGNHDIEPGHKVYDKWIREVHCPVLGANIVKEEFKNGEARQHSIYTGVKPYSVHYKDGVKICVIGMLTPAIPNWLNESLWEGMHFQEMTSCASQWVEELKRTEKPDVIIGVFHSGKDGGIKTPEYEEDASVKVAQQVPGFDLILYGHDHTTHRDIVTNSEGKEVLCLDPSCNALHVSDAEITLTLKKGKVIDRKVNGEIVTIEDQPIDEEYMSYFQADIDSVSTFVNRKIGKLRKTIYTRDSYFGNSAFCDLIHQLQLQLTGADISFNAPLSFNAIIREGDIYVSDMFNLYRYENQLYVMELTGEEVRKHLEMSYDLWVNTMTSPDDHIMLLNDGHLDDQQRFMFKNLAFNFDSAAGIDYEVDVTKPNGQKVRILRMSNGEPFDEKKVYKVALNSYRGNGGGELLTKGAGIPREELKSRTIYESEKDQRFYLMKEIEKAGVLDPQPGTNWKFVPEEWAEPALKRDRKLLFKE